MDNNIVVILLVPIFQNRERSIRNESIGKKWTNVGVHLQLVEEEMKKIVKESLSFQVYQVSREEAFHWMEKEGEIYKP